MVIRSFISAIVLLVGVLLSISSIIAIPIFDEEINTSSAELSFNLDKELNEISYSSIEYLKNQKLDTPTIQDIKAVNLRLNGRASLALLNNQWSTEIINSTEKINSAKYNVGIIFNSLGKIGYKRKINYQRNLILEFAKFCDTIKNVLFLKRNYIGLSISRLAIMSARREIRSEDISKDYQTFLSALNNSTVTEFKPRESPRVGDELGFFNLISGWLLRTESQNMAVITGLLGFGLFGAVISFWIKIEKTEPGPNTSGLQIMYDTFKIIARGFSAAIVVFLAAKGGIAVISTNEEGALNPYVIFFICFISSVYSEEIWTWAKIKMVKSYGL